MIFQESLSNPASQMPSPSSLSNPVPQRPKLIVKFSAKKAQDLCQIQCHKGSRTGNSFILLERLLYALHCFCYGVRQGSEFILWHVDTQVIQPYSLPGCSLPYWRTLLHLSKLIWPQKYGSTSEFPSLFHWSLCLGWVLKGRIVIFICLKAEFKPQHKALSSLWVLNLGDNSAVCGNTLETPQTWIRKITFSFSLSINSNLGFSFIINGGN